MLKLTDESIEKYRKKLQEAVTEASADYNSAALSSAKEKVSASYSYNLSVAEGSVAQEEYEATISELQDGWMKPRRQWMSHRHFLPIIRK